MLKNKRKIAFLLILAASISCGSSFAVSAAEDGSGSEVAASEYYSDIAKTGVDSNNITWAYDECPDGTIAIWQHDSLSGEVEIPEKINGRSVSKIKNYGFNEAVKITKVKIPGTVKEIGKMAFYGCTALKNIEIPSSVTEIGESAFENTPWLTDQRKANPMVVVNSILIDGRSATGNVVIPDGVTKIADAAFIDFDLEHKYRYGNSTSITSVKIPIGVKKIGECAFSSCSNLTHIEIPITVTEIGDAAFSACPINVLVPNKNVKIENRAGGPPSNQNIQIGNEELHDGWYSDGESWYWLFEDGSKRTAWYYEGGNWYYFYGNGQMATGFINLNGAYYYLDESNTSNIGIMKTGWQKINGSWYYFNRDSSEGITGMMNKGWNNIDGTWYYFYYDDGTMAHDTWIGNYYVNSSGAWV